ncbi:glycosyltransferase [Pigmentiphaga sp. CHJ604]|uniref:glycosyltransferase n=1 Tax=Pigmentiphaga sp. CHJ604 TaxID=3081984 RepID=UPI0030D33599
MANYLVIVATSVGGAERRFIDIFCSLRERGVDLTLVTSARLAKLAQIDKKFLPSVVILGAEKSSLLSFCFEYFKWWKKNTRALDKFHYPVNALFFLHFFSKQVFSISLTNCYYAPRFTLRSRSQLRQYIAMIFARRVDVLNPSIHQAVCSYKISSAEKISLTPGGTFVYSENQANISFIAKRPIVGMISRLIEGKGIFEFLNILPALWTRLQNEVPPDFCFFIAGHGKLEEEVKERIKTLSDQGIPIKYLGFIQPKKLLPECSIVFSLQEITNYPSRVVAESLLHGCEVYVSDTGDSRDFGENICGLHYINPKLNAKFLSELILKTLQCQRNFPHLSRIVQDAKHRFCNEAVLDYFEDLMLK